MAQIPNPKPQIICLLCLHNCLQRYPNDKASSHLQLSYLIRRLNV